MKFELRKIKSGAVNPRNGCKPTSAELFCDNVKIAELYDPADGSIVLDETVEHPILYAKFEEFVRSQKCKYEGFENEQMTIEEWFAEECDKFETLRTLKRKTKSAIVMYNEKTQEMITNKTNVEIKKIMANPMDRQKLIFNAKRMVEKYSREGFVIINEELKPFL